MIPPVRKELNFFKELTITGAFSLQKKSKDLLGLPSTSCMQEYTEQSSPAPTGSLAGMGSSSDLDENAEVSTRERSC